MRLAGVLFFPVTPFAADGAVDEAALTTHIKQGLDAGPGGVFAACGTGEFHALEPLEAEQVVRTAVQVTDGRVPVFAGAGGPLPLAKEYVRAAERAGADGVLLLPPYLVKFPVDGLVRYVEEIAAESSLPVIVYQRGNAVFTPEAAARIAALPNVVGFKDGTGDLDLMQRIVLTVRAAVGKDFQFFNGMPTAEMTVPAYRAVGVDLWSSAVFCFAPEISLAFHRAVSEGDTATVDRLLSGFFQPLVELRHKAPGYAVSLVKAAVRLGGLEVGGVRPPLVDPAPEHVEQLRQIITAGKVLV
ncbi:5-dehydro-4-deoxyglucarate dehydratase [Streptomyces sp. NBC_01549]|uniref:5-dehydro-4-deoxyglucarate dehydratase n=1 Tax=Streptomyces sp. NBC_01549 TaxID=2975874 RepID=UPI002250F280|nr:5-dehydro-4-deoxyglucarate dehydratase [Streptomyces sp. NBC_01549]MCX4594105.1 5-dehydro-4-deoxyglucarate dehydratase [Streptomyces sp. NBC_01549]